METLEKRISDIQENEVCSLFDKELLLTKLEDKIIMVSKNDISLMTTVVKRHNYKVEPSDVNSIHKMISNMNRTGFNFAQMMLIELVQTRLVPSELKI